MALGMRSRRNIAKAIHDGKPFQIASMSGKWVEYLPSTGRLPQEYVNQLKSDIAGKDVYVVYSYATPIGWSHNTRDQASWMIPPIRYSNTTTGHQSVLSVAVLPNSPYLD